MSSRTSGEFVLFPDVHAVVADDHLVDRLSLGEGQPASRVEGALQLWREELVFELPASPTGRDLRTLAAGSSQHRPRIDRSPASARRPWAAAAAIAASIVVLLGGSTVIGARAAQPGDLLWSVTRAIWADQADSVVAGRAADALVDARSALRAGDFQAARVALARAAAVLPMVSISPDRDKLRADWRTLTATVQRTATQRSVAAPTAVTTDDGIPAGPPALSANAAHADPTDRNPAETAAGETGPARSSRPATSRPIPQFDVSVVPELNAEPQHKSAAGVTAGRSAAGSASSKVQRSTSADRSTTDATGSVAQQRGTIAPRTTAPRATAPRTTAPRTTAPRAIAPRAIAPKTAQAATTAPITTAPITTAPITTAPITTAPITTAPMTIAPITPAPITAASINSAPATAALPEPAAPMAAAQHQSRWDAATLSPRTDIRNPNTESGGGMDASSPASAFDPSTALSSEGSATGVPSVVQAVRTAVPSP